MSPVETDLDCLLSPDAPDHEIAASLAALSGVKPAAEDLAAMARAILARAKSIALARDAIDVCGTGGDHANTLNVSTAVAFVAAAGGAKVAKHGNRAASSRSGGIDVLEALGVSTDLPPEAAERQLADTGLTFLSAARYHPVLARLAPFRKALGKPTMFNLVGPLINPARVRRQLIGVYSPSFITIMAEAARQLGLETAWVACGGGTDELSCTALNEVAVLDNGGISHHSFDGHNGPVPPGTLTGGDAQHNAAEMVSMLSRAAGLYRETVVLNTAAALVVAGIVTELEAGLDRAQQAIDSGAALAKLKQMQDWGR